jgi:hypothetical protein
VTAGSVVEHQVPVSHADAVRGHVASVAEALTERLGEVTIGMRDVLAHRVHELDGDPVLLDLLGASIEGNVVNIAVLRRGALTCQVLAVVFALVGFGLLAYG